MYIRPEVWKVTDRGAILSNRPGFAVRLIGLIRAPANYRPQLLDCRAQRDDVAGVAVVHRAAVVFSVKQVPAVSCAKFTGAFLNKNDSTRARATEIRVEPR